jgi:tetratricopeptide (TPR) repeat protein
MRPWLRYVGTLLIAGMLLAACDSPKERAAKYVDHGKALYTSGDFVKAALEFKNALQINPASTEPRYYLGLIAEKQHDLNAAAAAFQKVADADPKHYEAHVKAGQYALLAGDAEGGRRYADQVIALDPKKAEGHTMKAAAFMMENKLDDAAKEANAALALEPNNTDALVVLASQKARSGDNDGALALVERGLTANPKSADLLLVKLRLMYDQHRTADVIAVLQRLNELDPKNPNYAVDLGNQLAAAGKPEDADKTFRSALDANPDADAVLGAYAGFLVATKNVDGAIQAIKQLTAQAQHPTKYALLLEQLYLRTGKLDEAKALMEDLQQKATVVNDRLQAQVELARITYLKGDKSGALDQLKTVLDKDASNEPGLLLRAAIMVETSKFDDAIADARSVLRRDINSIGGLTILGKAYAATGERDLAIETYRSLLRISPNDVEARLQLASLLAAKSPTDAIDNLDAAIALRPDAVELKVQKAEYLVRIGSADKAELIAQDLLKDPKLAGVAHRILGEAAIARTDFSTAISELNQAQAAGEDFGKVGGLLVTAYVRAGKAAEADKMLSDRIAANAKDGDAMVLLAAIRQQSGKSADAEKLLNDAIAAEPDDSAAYLDLSQLLASQHKLQDASKVADAAAAKFPGNQAVARFAAISADTAGNLAAAKSGYESILAKWPDDAVAANNLAALIADTEATDPTQLSRARQLAEKFRNSGDPLLLDTLGWVLVRQGSYDDATILLEKSASMVPNNQQIQFHYAVALKQKGLTAKAKAALAKALAGTPDYRGVDEAKTLAAALQ